MPVCSCRGTSDFPDLHFHIGGKDYFIPREDYVFEHDYLPICFLGMIAFGDINLWIMGLNFFKNYYTVFDQEHKRIGFALSHNANERIFGLMAEANKTRALKYKKDGKFAKKMDKATGNVTNSSSKKNDSTKANKSKSILSEDELSRPSLDLSVADLLGMNTAADNIPEEQELYGKESLTMMAVSILSAMGAFVLSAFAYKKWRQKNDAAIIEGGKDTYMVV